MIHREPMAEKIEKYGGKIVKLRDDYGITFKRIASRWGMKMDWAYRIYLEKKKEMLNEKDKHDN